MESRQPNKQAWFQTGLCLIKSVLPRVCNMKAMLARVGYMKLRVTRLTGRGSDQAPIKYRYALQRLLDHGVWSVD